MRRRLTRALLWQDLAPHPRESTDRSRHVAEEGNPKPLVLGVGLHFWSSRSALGAVRFTRSDCPVLGVLTGGPRRYR